MSDAELPVPAEAGEAPAPRTPQPDPYAMRLRMKFTKLGPVRFLSHLDLLKCVERSLRRSGVPVAYTEGFHPRIRISFGPALALGHASVCEWMDLDMAEIVEPEAVMRDLNRAFPKGLEVRSARVLESGAKALQAAVQRACYRVVLDGAREGLRTRLREVLEQQEIPLQKKNKVVNLRSFIEDLQVLDDDPPVVEMVLRVGQEGSVRPEDVLGAVFPGEAAVASVERIALLAVRDGKWDEP